MNTQGDDAETGSAGLQYLGRMLREIRIKHDHTHVQISSITKISQSRLSKLENGKASLPDFKDLVRILEAIGASAEERDQLKRQHELAQLDQRSYAFMQAVGLDAKQRQLRDLALTCKLYRSYSRSVFSGIIQLPEYANGVFTSLGLTAEDAARAVEARVERAGILADMSRRFILAVDEGVLYTRHPPESDWRVLLNQLDYVLRLSYQANIDIRILPARGPAPADIANPFLLIDRRYVSAELVTVEYVTTDVQELRAHELAFHQIERYSTSGGATRDLLSHAMKRAEQSSES